MELYGQPMLRDLVGTSIIAIAPYGQDQRQREIIKS